MSTPVQGVEYVIEFGPKFCQVQMQEIFKDLNSANGESNVQNSHWGRSLNPDYKSIIFDLTLLEWISTEQITFLFAWIKNVKTRKHVKVRLPLRAELRHTVGARLKEYEKKYADYEGASFIDGPSRLKRRKRGSSFLLAIYGLLDKVGLKSVDFDNLATFETYNKEARQLKSFTHQIIPFTPLDLSYSIQNIKLDSHFLEIIGTNLDQSNKAATIFDLEEDLRTLLQDSACYSPIESKVLSNVITHELYINSLQHAFEESTPFYKECYITAFLSKPWETLDEKKFIGSFVEEKYPEALDFYRDKKAILIEINKVLSSQKKAIDPREADLSRYNRFLNQSYLEFSFTDFGQGIAQTLEEQFDRVDIRRLVKEGCFSADFEKANRHSQIIEYAMQLDTSRNPLDRTIDHYEFVPRGLYFLTDMVRRYKGLIIVRSGFGAVFYDFSDKIFIEKRGDKNEAVINPCFKIREAIRHRKQGNEYYFPGTLYTIIIPQKEAEDEEIGLEEDELPNNDINEEFDATVIPAVRREQDTLSSYAYSLTNSTFRSVPPYDQFSPERYEYFSVLFHYNAIIERLRDTQNEVHVKEIYNKLFSCISEALDGNSSDSSITFFDFCGLTSGNVSWIKILYFLMITPKVNERRKVVIFNLPGIERAIVGNINENHSLWDYFDKGLEHFKEPYLFRPIPCIRFKIDAQSEAELVDWIGLKSNKDKAVLTRLLLNDKKPKPELLSEFKNVNNIEGNLFYKLDERLHRLDGFGNLSARFEEVQKEGIINFLRKYISDGLDPQTKEQKYVYITASGGYQYQYLSLYEILHDKYIARYFAKCLLDRYCLKIQRKYTGEPLSLVHRFNKIIAVTVSSQLIAIALRDLIEEDDSYSFFRDNEGTSETAPEVIMLSSYYSFDREKPFEKIVAGDSVLIVNDVISTGSLVASLNDKIDAKKAIVTAIFSIADTRVPKKERLADQTEKEVKCATFPDEIQFVSLVCFDDGIQLRKFEGPYKGDCEPKRINPLLNTIVDLHSAHSEKRQILFDATDKLLEDTGITSTYFKVGHFQQNLTHNGYLTHMRSLFTTKEGVKLMEEVKAQIDIRFRNGEFVKGNSLPLVDIQHEMEKFSKNVSPSFANDANEILQKILALRISLEAEEGKDTDSKEYKPDFIFYPVFSGIERMKQYRISKLFGTHPDNIIGLQRFDTPKGWRFPFPAKRFNRLTKNKSILILDSGSLTGESLVQLIDNIGFLDVREIVVVSVVTRVEEFYREFYSRLRSLKVKKLKSRTLVSDDTSVSAENIVPIEVLFGINLHIPVYASSVSCPFCEELEYIHSIKEHKPTGNDLLLEVKEYINLRSEELKLLNSSKDRLSNAAYLPLDRVSGEVDAKNIFLMRDALGKVDSYRFYSDYFERFNNIISRTIKEEKWIEEPQVDQEIELILICLLHENQLFELVTNYLNGIVPVLKEYLKTFVLKSVANHERLYYKWSLLSLLRVSFVVFKNKEHANSDVKESPVNDMLLINNFEAVLSWENQDCKHFLYYKLYDLLYKGDATASEQNSVEHLLRTFNEKLGTSDSASGNPNADFYRLLGKYYQSRKIGKYLNNAFYNLMKFVANGESSGRHFFLAQKLNDVINSIQSTKPSLKNIVKYLRDVILVFDDDLKPNLEKIKTVNNLNQECKTLYTFFFREDRGVYSFIQKTGDIYDKLKNLNDDELDLVLSDLENLKELCKTMVKEVFNPANPDECFYKISKQYPVTLAPVLMDLKAKEQCSTLQIEVENDLDDVTEVDIHHHMLESVLNEIVKNAREKRVSNEPVLLTFSFSHVLKAVRLVVKQSYPYQPPKKNDGGMTSIVKYYIGLFEGGLKDNSQESLLNQTDYEIYIVLKNHHYE